MGELDGAQAADREVAQAEATTRRRGAADPARRSGLLQRAGAEDGLEANQASLEAISRQLDQANKRFEVGLIAITDVQEAKADRQPPPRP